MKTLRRMIMVLTLTIAVGACTNSLLGPEHTVDGGSHTVDGGSHTVDGGSHTVDGGS